MQGKKALKIGTIGAIIIAVTMFMVFYRPVSLAGDTHYLVVLTGSMKPTIPVGSVIAVKPVDFRTLKEGDIITFGISKELVTHRIFNITDEGIITKGDANKAPDKFFVSQSNIVGKVVLVIPYLGYLCYIAKTPLGFALLIILPATIIITQEIKNIINHRKTSQQKDKTTSLTRRRKENPKETFTLILTFVLLGLMLGPATFSWFYDVETSKNNVISAGVWPVLTRIRFSLVPNPAYVCQTVTMLGNLTDELNHPINNTEVDVLVNGKFTLSLFTNSSGWFKASAKVDTTGTYIIKVVFDGSEIYKPSNHTETLSVQKMNTKVQFTLSPNPAKAGQTITMLGNLTDINNNPIGNAPLEVYAKTCTGPGPWQYMGTISTNSSGWFEATGKIAIAGKYQVAVLYKGSYKYNMSYHIETLTVNLS